MAYTPISFNVPWDKALKVLGISQGSSGLPYKCKCPNPKCSSNLTIYQDVTTTGQWFYCMECRLSGDMTELVATHLGISVSEAVSLLTSKRLIPRRVRNYERKLSDYLNKTVEFRHKLLGFWDRCRKNGLDMQPEYAEIVKVMGLSVGCHWENMGSRMIGFCHKRDAENALIVKDKSRSCLNSGCNRPFIGDGWGHVCVIPAFDMPGRIRTITFIGISQNDGSILETSRSIVYKTWGIPGIECGVIFLEQVMGLAEKNVIISSDTIDSVRLALDYTERTGKFPPLVVQPDQPDKMSLSWRLFKEAGAKVIAVGDRAATTALSDTSLHVSDQPSDWRQPWMGPQKWINKVIEGSHPQIVLDESNQDKTTDNRTAVYGGKKYEERPDGIYQNNEIECDAVLIVEKVITDNQKHYYHGHVMYEGARIPFHSDIAHLDNHYSKWLKDLCLNHGMSMPRCTKEYSKVAVKVATLITKPEREVVNNDPESLDAYRFALHYIDKSGRVAENARIERRRSSLLMSGDPLNEFEKGALSEDGSALVWAVASCVLANALSGKLHMQSIGIGVDTDSFEAAKNIGTRLGCTVNKMTGMFFAKSVMSTTLAMETDLMLPMIADPEKLNAPLQKLTLQRAVGARNCMIGIDRLAVLGARTISRWAYIRDHQVAVDEVLESAIGKITLNFLSWMTANGHGTDGRGLFHKTVNALKRWCEHEGIDSAGLEAGVGLVECDCTSSRNKYVTEAFVELCKTLLMMDAIETFKRDDHSRTKLKFNKETWLPCREIFTACKHHNIPVSEPGKLTASLMATKTVIHCANNPDNRLISWVIPEDKWAELCAGV